MASKRQPPGTPSGGQYAAGVHPESDVTLDDGLVPVRSGGDNYFEWRLPNGVLHCVDGPAVQTGGGVAAGGTEYWFLDGKYHRTDGPAVQLDGGVAAGGGETWWLNGVLHRVDGPAVQTGGGVAAGGHEEWHLNGKRHRVDGPAVQLDGGVAADGSEEYWLDGVQVEAGQYRLLAACRGETRRVTAPVKQNPGRPQPSDGTARPGV